MFFIMKKNTILLTVLVLTMSVLVSGQTNFGWETAVASGDTTTETIDGITVTTTNGNNGAGISIPTNWGGWQGSTDNVVRAGTTTMVTFTFDQSVDVNSILPMDGSGSDVNFTFTRVDGSGISPVNVSLTGGGAPGLASIDLNWTGVTSFTVMASSSSLMAFDNLSVSAITPPPVTLFGWETAVASGDTTTETIDGVTVTTTNGNNGAGISIPTNWGGWQGSTDNVVRAGTTTMVTFTFDQSVDVNSILPMDGSGSDVNFTFTRVDGSGISPVNVSLTGGGAPGLASIDLNWTGVTSFTVMASSSSLMAFDNLSINGGRLSVERASSKFQNVQVFPNPVENTLYVKNISDLKYIKVYNNLGQLVLMSKKDTIDASHLSIGMYFLQIHDSQGVEVKRVIKK